MAIKASDIATVENGWSTDCPKHAGAYDFTCGENDGEIEQLIVWHQTGAWKNPLVTRSTHIGRIGLSAFHNGLTNPMWHRTRTVAAADIKRGAKLVRPDEKECPARVMAVADGYAMVRYPGCTPFCVSVKDIVREWYTA